MLNTLWGIAREEKIELLEKVDIPEGTKVLVTLLTDKDDQRFWQSTSQVSLDAIWNNTEDDVYAQLLKE
jgi:predicted DNA-binding antitoxin AbrB/MazE fold protein